MQRFDTEYSADSVEFCPVRGFMHLVAVGTYQVIEDESVGNNTKRTGRILLFDTSASETVLVQQIECGACLDMRW